MLTEMQIRVLKPTAGGLRNKDEATQDKYLRQSSVSDGLVRKDERKTTIKMRENTELR